MKQQWHILFSGRVQGVSFRYTTQRLALKVGVTGWVRNLEDGRVELTAQGDITLLQDFLAQIEQHFATNIAQKKVTEMQVSATFSDFQILY